MVTDRLFPAVISAPQGIAFYIITAVFALLCGGLFVCPACPPVLLYTKESVRIPYHLHMKENNILVSIFIIQLPGIFFE